MLRMVPPKYKNTYARAMSGKSRKAAMRAQCLDCVAYQEAEVALCTDRGCPLYPYRVLPRKNDNLLPIAGGRTKNKEAVNV